MIDHAKDQHDMKQIVYSQEAKRIYEDDLKGWDHKALTKEGVIHAYKIDDASIQHDRMRNGVAVSLIINNNPDITLGITLTRYLDASGHYGPLQLLGEPPSREFLHLVDPQKYPQAH